MDIWRTQEQGTTTLEFVGLAVAVSVLLGGVALGLSGSGGAVAGSVASVLERAIDGTALSGRVPPRPQRPVDVAPEVFDNRERTYGSTSTAHEQRWATGDDAPRVPRSDLRMNPIMGPSLSVWDASRSGAVTGPAGLGASGTATLCLMCIDANWRDGLRSGVSTQKSLDLAHGDLVNADLQAEARAAVMGLDLLGVVQQRAGWGDWKVQGRVRASVGGDASGKLTLRVGRDAIEVGASGGAMAGAVVRGEARAGVDLLGVAATTRAQIEGWAGAGVRGNASVTRTGSVFSWDAGAGAALGLGGSFDWGGSVDVSKLEPTHRAAALTTLGLAASVIFPGASNFFHLPTHHHRSH